jgi:molecular chaperone GrpE
MTREPDIVEALQRVREAAEEGAPQGAPEPSAPAGDPQARVAPATPDEAAAETAATPDDAAAETAATPDQAAAEITPTPDEAAAETAETDHERQLEHDLEELWAKAEKADEYLELAQRTRADFENYRKRATREAAVAQERGVAKLAKELLPAVDNLDRALEAAKTTAAKTTDGTNKDNGTATLISGIKLVHADVIAALARAGIEGFSPEGERFDPQLHEAIAQMPVEGAEPGTVVEVYQRGYRLGEAVIRPARVVVAA